MSTRDIVVIGGSAGSLPFLTQLISDLSENFPASVFVVIHLRGRAKSMLAAVLSRAGHLQAIEAVDGARIEKGMVYVAPPDRHLLIAEGHIHLSRGPKEGLHRPSINVTFRSAAASYGSHVVGILLSGMLDDGASGLWEIVHSGGISIVQDPQEARFPSMPTSALEAVPINYKLRADEIGPQLLKLVYSSETPAMCNEVIVNEISKERFSGFTCPECRGPLYEHRSRPAEFRCRVGHIFPLETLIEESTSTQERKMYEAMVSLEEGADMAEFAARGAKDGPRHRLLSEAKQLRKHSRAIRGLIEERQAPVVDETNA